MNKSYPHLVKHFCDTTLLHLYLTCAETTRFVPLHRRNACLIKYLKPLSKCLEFQPIRKDIKTLLNLGKKSSGDIEKHLIKLRKLVDNFDNDVERFYELLSKIEDDVGLFSCLYNDVIDKDKIYVLENDIDNGFDIDGNQIGPISLITNSSSWQKIAPVVDTQAHFTLNITTDEEDLRRLTLTKRMSDFP